MEDIDEKVESKLERTRRRNREKYAANPEKYRAKGREWARAHAEEVAEKSRRYRAEHPAQCKESKLKYNATHPESVKMWNRTKYLKHKEKYNAISKQYQVDHRDRLRELNRKWKHDHPEMVREAVKREYIKRMTTPRLHLNTNISRAIHNSLKRGAKHSRHWEDLVGFTIDNLKCHLEEQFQEGMTWENYGEWHIDHRLPKAAFNFETPEDIDFQRCWSLSNLQPMWAKENISKGARLSKPFQPALAIAVNF
jgi:hypothetical protein